MTELLKTALYFRGDQISDFLKCATIVAKNFDEKTGGLIAEAVAKIMLGQLEYKAHNGLRPITLTQNGSCDEMWKQCGGHAILLPIFKYVAKNGGSPKYFRNFIRLVNGERYETYSVIPRKYLDLWASKKHYDFSSNEEYTRGYFDENGMLATFDGYKVKKMGNKTYLLNAVGYGFPHLSLFYK